ncbi:MAG: fluoride efflux transporter CrcB [Pirellula sp.]
MNWFANVFANPWFLVGVGGAAGSCARFGVGQLMQQAFASQPIPLATTIVNLIGSFALGCIVGAVAQDKSSPMYLMLGVGLCGGFTTFSTFSMELVEHMQQGRMAYAFGECMIHITLGTILFFAGLWVCR